MITSFILDLFYSIVVLLVTPILMLADVTADSGLLSAVTNVIHYIANFNDILPLLTLFAVIAIIITTESIIAIYKIIMWFIRRIPTQS